MTFTIKLETKLRHSLFKIIIYSQKSPKILGVNKPRSAKIQKRVGDRFRVSKLSYHDDFTGRVKTPPLILLSIKNL